MPLSNNAILPNNQLIEKLQASDMTLDQDQLSCCKNLTPILKKPRPFFDHKPRAFYLWGAPGRGKTMIMDALYNLSDYPKYRIHYHQFLYNFIEQIFHLSISEGAKRDSLFALANDMTEKFKLFCFDEFHIHDVTTIILLTRFFEVMLKKRVRIIITSNVAPQCLYPGVEHERALPMINLLQKHFNIIALNGHTDYRTNQEISNHMSNFSCTTDDILIQRFNLNNLDFKQESIELAGRRVAIKAHSPQAIWFLFQDLCGSKRSAMDYLELARRWQLTILTNIRQIDLDNPNSLQRFIWLIDILYDQNIGLILASEIAIISLLNNTKSKNPDLSRTISRLTIMEFHNNWQNLQKK